MLADVSRPLRDEERQAWQRLIRVIGHEINNSLAPIKSIAGSLESMLARDAGGRQSIGSRNHRGHEARPRRDRRAIRFAQPLHDRLCAPRQAAGAAPRHRQRAGNWCAGSPASKRGSPIHVADGPDVEIRADPDQLEQLLINLVHNAVGRGAADRRRRRRSAGNARAAAFELWIDDEGSGLTNASNLFVPFFTTKPGGSGIGLVLSRQIAEAHGGTLTLENRTDRRGCRAYLRLPV